MAKPRSDLKHRPSVAAFLVLFCLALSLSQGCAGPDPLRHTGGGSPVGQTLPFHPDTVHASSGDSAPPALPPDPKSAGELPFNARSHTYVLPSGTLLTVQLSRSLSAARVHSGDAFGAVVADPVTVNGETLVDRGTEVIGRIESAASEAGRVPPLGYFRLRLDAITLGGNRVALQTSSLFARGSARPSTVSSGSSSVRVQKGRRLTFRLIAPVTLYDPNRIANQQYADSTTQ
ncbi:MAG: hypothetical protein WA510_11060 [Acidobacteriaceae bacterium]